MIETLTLLRIASTASLISWVCIGTLVIPWLVEAHPRKHPIGLLLVTIVVIEVVRSAFHLDASFEASYVLDSSRGNAGIIALRFTSILEAGLIATILWRIKRHG